MYRSNYGLIAVLTVLVIFIGGMTSPLFADDAEWQSLKGIRGVHVLVAFDPNLTKGGLTEKEIRNIVELKLQRASINVLSEEELRETPGKPLLHVKTIAALPSDYYIYTCILLFEQAVHLVRQPQIRDRGITWTGKGFLGIDKDLTGFKRLLELSVEEFINAYLAANPK